MRVGNGFERAKAATLFRNFAIAQIVDGFQVRFGRRANNPLLLKANFEKETWTVPWPADRLLDFDYVISLFTVGNRGWSADRWPIARLMARARGCALQSG